MDYFWHKINLKHISILLILCVCFARQSYADGNPTPLMVAAKTGDMIKLERLINHTLLDESDDQGKTALIYGILNDHLNVVAVLIDQGANINQHNPLDGTTPLMYAATIGDPGMMSYLLSQGALTNAHNLENETALIYATRSGNTTAALLLLQHGADFNACNKSNENAYIISVNTKQHEMIQQLTNYATLHCLSLTECTVDVEN